MSEPKYTAREIRDRLLSDDVKKFASTAHTTFAHMPERARYELMFCQALVVAFPLPSEREEAEK